MTLESAYELLQRATCVALLSQPLVENWEEKIHSQSPNLAPFLITGCREQSQLRRINIILKLPGADTRQDGTSVDEANEKLKVTRLSVAMLLAGGGAKAFVDLLRTWVERRKNRGIRIRFGASEIDIDQRTSGEQLEEMAGILQRRIEAPPAAGLPFGF